jgi:hypothetical protein
MKKIRLVAKTAGIIVRSPNRDVSQRQINPQRNILMVDNISIDDMRETEFPGYFVSREGGVYHKLKDGNLFKMKASMNNRRILVHGFYINGKSHMRTLAKLVANAYLPPHPNGITKIRHIDGNPDNNNSDNLEWANPPRLVNMFLDDNAIAFARELGGGKITSGVRKALQMALEAKNGT